MIFSKAVTSREQVKSRLLSTVGPSLSLGAIVTGPVLSNRLFLSGFSMSDKLQVFSFEQRQVRTVVVNGEPHFVAADVCAILEVGNVTVALSRLDSDEFSSTEVTDSTGRAQQTKIITESGLYSLVLGSRKPEAKAFKRWITHEVLPALRREGRYEVAADSDEATLMLASRVTQLITQKRELAAQVAEQSQQLEEARPKVAFFDAVTDSTDATDIGSAAKVLNLGVGRTKLFQFLRDEQVLMANNLPYQEFIDRAWFRVVEQKFTKPDGSTHLYFKTLVFQRGLDGIRRLWARRHEKAEAAQVL